MFQLLLLLLPVLVPDTTCITSRLPACNFTPFSPAQPIHKVKCKQSTGICERSVAEREWIADVGGNEPNLTTLFLTRFKLLEKKGASDLIRFTVTSFLRLGCVVLSIAWAVKHLYLPRPFGLATLTLPRRSRAIMSLWRVALLFTRDNRNLGSQIKFQPTDGPSSLL